MATVVDSLLITLGLDSSQVRQGMRQAENTIGASVKTITSTILAPLAAGFAFGSIVGDFVKTGLELRKMSTNLKMNVVDIQAWQGAVRASGEDVGAFMSSLGKIEETLKRVRMSRWGGNFRVMGVQVRDANGQLKDAGQIMQDIAAKADKMDPRRFALYAKRFGFDDSTIRMLQKGSKELGILLGKYKALALTQEDTDIAAQYDLAQFNLSKTFQAVAAIMMRIFVPAITFVTDKMAAFVNFLREHEPFVIAFFATLAAVALPFLAKIAIAAGAALLPFLPLILIVSAIAFLIDDLWTYVAGGPSLFEDLWKEIGTGEEILKMVSDAWADMKAIGTAAWEALGPAAQGFFALMRAAVKPFVSMFQNALKTIKSLFQGNFQEAGKFALDAIMNLGELIVTVLVGALNMVGEAGRKIIPALLQFIVGILNGIVDKVVGVVKDVVKELPDFVKTDSMKEWSEGTTPPGPDPQSDEAQYTYVPGKGLVQGVRPGQAPAQEGAKAGGGTTENTSIDNSTQIGNIAITVTSTDPVGAGNEVKAQLERLANNRNSGVNRGS